MQCHSSESPRWSKVEEHQAMLDDIRKGEMACIGCHSDVHPTALSRRKTAAGAPGPEEKK